MKTLLTTFLLMLCTAVGAQTAEKLYDEGKALYDAKKYTQALPKLKAAAEKGHKKAQYRMGRCYDKGNGVKEDDKQQVLLERRRRSERREEGFRILLAGGQAGQRRCTAGTG